MYYIFNFDLQKACNGVSFDWFNNEQKYKMIKTKDINALYNERKKYACIKQIKKQLLKLLENIL